MNPLVSRVCISTLVLMLVQTAATASSAVSDLVNIAISNDDWLAASRMQQAAREQESKAADTLPDPQLSFGMLNLPVNGLDLNQEPMTQLKFTITQAMPRGDSRAINARISQRRAGIHASQRQVRKAELTRLVLQQLITLVQRHEALQRIAQDRALFEQLVAVVEAKYASAKGMTRQQDIIRAQLALSRLDERVANLNGERHRAIARLSEWLAGQTTEAYKSRFADLGFEDFHSFILSNDELSHWQNRLDSNPDSVASILQSHPELAVLSQNIRVFDEKVALAEQSYQPQWQLNAGYGWRDDAPDGSSRADFLSMGISVSMPLFSQKRQDSKVQAARYDVAALETQKRLYLTQMRARVEALLQESQSLQARIKVWQQQILPQMREQAEASLSAYTHDDGDFAEVMRARIEALEAHLAFISLTGTALDNQVQLAYYLRNLEKGV